MRNAELLFSSVSVANTIIVNCQLSIANCKLRPMGITFTD